MKKNNVKEIMSYLSGFLFVWIIMYGQVILLHYSKYNVWKLFFNPLVIVTGLSEWPAELFFFYILFAIPLFFTIGKAVFYLIWED